MASDPFLNKKSVLGLEERVIMSTPPQKLILDLVDGQWSRSGTQDMFASFVNRMTVNDLKNYQSIVDLSQGQSILIQFNEQTIGETITMPIVLLCIDNFQNYILRGTLCWKKYLIKVELDYNQNGQIAFSVTGKVQFN